MLHESGQLFTSISPGARIHLADGKHSQNIFKYLKYFFLWMCIKAFKNKIFSSKEKSDLEILLVLVLLFLIRF